MRVSFYFISETGCLLNANVCRTLYIEHQLSGLFAASAIPSAAYRVDQEIGVFSANDIRRARA